MPVIVGVARSGTTLLRLMLDAHPELSIPPETHFIPLMGQLGPDDDDLRERFFRRLYTFDSWGDFGLDHEQLRQSLADIEPFDVSEGIRAFYRLYAARNGKRRWGDKTPNYCVQLTEVENLLPEAHFVHIIRDGRDVAVSVRGLRILPSDDIEVIARDWVHRITTARTLAARCQRYMELRYEDLVGDPPAELRRVAEFVDLGYRPEMERYFEHAAARMGELRKRVNAYTAEVVFTREERLHNHRLTGTPPNAGRVGRWRSELRPDEQVRFRAVAGDLLDELGYDSGS